MCSNGRSEDGDAVFAVAAGDGSNSGNRVAVWTIKSPQVLVSTGFSCIYKDVSRSNRENSALLIMWFINKSEHLIATSLRALLHNSSSESLSAYDFDRLRR